MYYLLISNGKSASPSFIYKIDRFRIHFGISILRLKTQCESHFSEYLTRTTPFRCSSHYCERRTTYGPLHDCHVSPCLLRPPLQPSVDVNIQSVLRKVLGQTGCVFVCAGFLLCYVSQLPLPRNPLKF